MAEQEKHPTGRPRLTFDLRQVEEMGRIQSTQAELAAVLGCGLSTVKDRLTSDEEFAAAYRKGLEAGKASLRRLQWKSALAGNVVMQIWLGKQYLSQRDQPTVVVTQHVPEPDEAWARFIRTEEGAEAMATIAELVVRAEEAMEAEARSLSAGHVAELPALPAPGPAEGEVEPEVLDWGEPPA
jgi:hypothetical protein